VDRRLGIHGHLTAKTGEKLTLSLTYRELTVTAYKDNVQEAMKQPMTEDKLKAPIEKIGDTLYYFEELLVTKDDNIFVPVAWLNDIRREAIRMLTEAVTGKYRREIREFPGAFEADTVYGEDNRIAGNRNSKGITVSVQTEEQFEVVLKFPEVTGIYAEYDRFHFDTVWKLAKQAGEAEKQFYLSLPRICRISEYSRLEEELYGILDNIWISGFLVKNFEEIALLKSLMTGRKTQKEIILNYNMYTYNREAKEFYKELGITRFSAPVELNYQELKALGALDSDLLVYGYIPLMISAQCLYESTVGCKKNVQNRSGSMTDRLGKKFYVQTNCRECYNTIYNGQALALNKYVSEITSLMPYNLRMEFSIETPKQMEQILKIFVDTFWYGKKEYDKLTDYTTGHFKRGID
jgi:putative protease